MPLRNWCELRGATRGALRSQSWTLTADSATIGPLCCPTVCTREIVHSGAFPMRNREGPGAAYPRAAAGASARITGLQSKSECDGRAHQPRRRLETEPSPPHQAASVGLLSALTARSVARQWKAQARALFSGGRKGGRGWQKEVARGEAGPRWGAWPRCSDGGGAPWEAGCPHPAAPLSLARSWSWRRRLGHSVRLRGGRGDAGSCTSREDQ